MGKRGRHGEHSHAKACPRHVSRGAWEYQARHRADVEDLGEQRGVRSAVRQRRPRHRAPIDVKVALGRILRDEENLQPLAAVTKSIVCGGEERRRRAACWTPRSGKVKPDHLMGSNQRSSDRGRPRQSEVIRGHQRPKGSPITIRSRGHQRSSAVISGHQRSSPPSPRALLRSRSRRAHHRPRRPRSASTARGRRCAAGAPVP